MDMARGGSRDFDFAGPGNKTARAGMAEAHRERCCGSGAAGPVGNIIDRIFRGYVVDFFDFAFMDWYVFNVADIYVVLGVIWLMFLMLFVIKDEPAADPHAEPDGEKKKGD